MNPTSDPRYEPEENEPIAEHTPGDVVDFIEKTVAEITDAEIDEHLYRILSQINPDLLTPFWADPHCGIPSSSFTFDRVNSLMLGAFSKQAADAAAERLQIAWDAVMVARQEADRILADARRQADETAAQLIGDAKEQAEQIIADARAEAESIRASATPQAITDPAAALRAQDRESFIRWLWDFRLPETDVEPTFSITALPQAPAGSAFSVTAVADAIVTTPEPTFITAVADAIAGARGGLLIIGACGNTNDEGLDREPEKADGSNTALQSAKALGAQMKRVVMCLPTCDEAGWGVGSVMRIYAPGCDDNYVPGGSSRDSLAR
jgi:vacuolar-type H+-ATPase subunit H